MEMNLKIANRCSHTALLGLFFAAFTASAQVDIVVADSCVITSKPIIMTVQMPSSCSLPVINWYKHEANAFVPVSQYSDIQVDGVNLTTMSSGEYKVEVTCEGGLPAEKTYALNRDNCM